MNRKQAVAQQNKKQICLNDAGPSTGEQESTEAGVQKDLDWLGNILNGTTLCLQHYKHRNEAEGRKLWGFLSASWEKRQQQQVAWRPWKERSCTLPSLLTGPPEESTSLGVSHEDVDSLPPELPALHPWDSRTTVSAI